jgi:hypothetical protein
MSSAVVWVVNALFYQFGNDATLSPESLLVRLLVGVLTSLIVFVPTTAVGVLFRRVRRRMSVGIKQSEWSDDDLNKINIDVRRVGASTRSGLLWGQCG